MQIEAVIFDVDGVLVDSPHEQAWRETLRSLMENEWREIAPQTRYAPKRFTSAVYQRVLAGKLRESGARAALVYFGVPDAAARARQYAERKQEALERLIAAGEVRSFPDGVRFALKAKALGLKTASASSSRNAEAIMKRVRVEATQTSLLDLFDANVRAVDVPRGKPDPAIFLAAAGALGAKPGRSLVVEDAPAGVQAAKAGGMRALGVARSNDAALLEIAGADKVVLSLDDVEVAQL